MIHFGAKSKTQPGPDVRINCPRCRREGVEAKTGVVNETTTIMFIPVDRSERNMVKCLNCGAVLVSRVPVSDLAYLSPKEIRDVLRIRVDWVSVAIAMLGFLLSPVPPFGLGFAMGGILMARKSPKWVRIIAWAGMFASLAWLALYIYRWRQGMFG